MEVSTTAQKMVGRAVVSTALHRGTKRACSHHEAASCSSLQDISRTSMGTRSLSTGMCPSRNCSVQLAVRSTFRRRMGSHGPNHCLKVKIKITASWYEQLFDGRSTSTWRGVEQFYHDVERRGPFRVLTVDVGLHALYHRFPVP